MQTVLQIAERHLRVLIDQRRGRPPLALVYSNYFFREERQEWKFEVRMSDGEEFNWLVYYMQLLPNEHDALRAGAFLDLGRVYSLLAEAELLRQHQVTVHARTLGHMRFFVDDVEPVMRPVRSAVERIADQIAQDLENRLRRTVMGFDDDVTTNAEPQAPAPALTAEMVHHAMRLVAAMPHGGGNAHGNLPGGGGAGGAGGNGNAGSNGNAGGGGSTYYNMPADFRASWVHMRLMRDIYYEMIIDGGIFERPDPKAAERGMALLKSWLTPRQLKQFEKRGYFDVIGNRTGRRYRIKRGRVQNVYEMGGKRFGKPTAGLCFAPEGNLVEGDVMLAQKVALETDEEAALAVANLFNPERYDYN